MKTIDSSRKLKHFQNNLRPSQSLHTRLTRSKNKQQSRDGLPKDPDQITVCILYRKKKIQFGVRNQTSFEQLSSALYKYLYQHILHETLNNFEKAAKILKTVVGFESVDGDINFDYRLSLKNGFIDKTKFFYPLLKASSSSEPFRYKIYNCLAVGGFSKVYLVRSLENGCFYAIKFIRKARGDSEGTVRDKDKF